MIGEEEVALPHDKIRPSTQHEENRDGFMSSTINELLEYYDPE